jgi:uncharacterized protein with FMN-binding domain
MNVLKNTMKAATAAISVALIVAGCAAVDRETARLTAAPNTVVTRSRSASSQDSSYANGVYTAIGRYGSLPSSITVTATLSDNVITAVKVTPHATDPTSRDYQERFANAVPAAVVGKPIDEVRVGRLAGASGTPNGFNAAIQRIKEQSRR